MAAQQSYCHLRKMSVESWTDFLKLCPAIEITDNVYNSFRSLASNKRLANIIEMYFDKCIDNMNTDKLISKQQSAISLREKGNEMFKKKQYIDAIKYYNKCLIYYVSESSEIFGLVLANRGMALLKINLFEKALCDFKLSLEKGYPENLNYKIYYRIAVCCHHLDIYEDFLCFSNLCKEKLCILQNETEKRNYQKDLEDIQLTEKSINKTSKLVINPAVTLPNEKLDGADVNVQLIHSGDFGRCIVAAKDLKKGQIIFVEKPFSFIPMIYDKNMLLEDECNVSIVCDFCGAFLINFVQCPDCSVLFYCDIQCKNEAWKIYHQFECHGLQSFILNNIGIGFLALRTFLRAVHNNFGMNNEQFDNFKLSKFQLKIEDIIKSLQDVVDNSSLLLGYSKVFNLVHHLDKMDQSDLSQYSVTCMMMTLYLEKYTDFHSILKEKLPLAFNDTEISILIDTLLLRHFGQIICNAQTIYKSDLYIDVDKNIFNDNIGGIALYPSVSMMNHSCSPNVNIQYFRNNIVVQASEDIECNQQVFNCYGHHFNDEDVFTRREILKGQYHFECNCKTCLAELN